jgi:uncharacterized protein YihD (DUF1040 family)
LAKVKNKQGNIGEEKMGTKLSEADMIKINEYLGGFIKIAPGFEIKLGELKDDRFIHVLRNDKIIGCFKKDDDNDLVFEFHSNYKGCKGCPSGKMVIKWNDLKDEDIKNAILRTRGKNYGA